jgi:hypothetical protein
MYVYLTDEAPDRQIELPEGVIVDLGASGTPVGVEMLNPHPSGMAWGELADLGIGRDDMAMLHWLSSTPFPKIVRGSIVVPPPDVPSANPGEVYEADLALT